MLWEKGIEPLGCRGKCGRNLGHWGRHSGRHSLLGRGNWVLLFRRLGRGGGDSGGSHLRHRRRMRAINGWPVFLDHVHAFLLFQTWEEPGTDVMGAFFTNWEGYSLVTDWFFETDPFQGIEMDGVDV